MIVWIQLRSVGPERYNLAMADQKKEEPFDYAALKQKERAEQENGLEAANQTRLGQISAEAHAKKASPETPQSEPEIENPEPGISQQQRGGTMLARDPRALREPRRNAQPGVRRND